MPRGRARKRAAARSAASQRPQSAGVGAQVSAARAEATPARRQLGGPQNVQNLWMSALVALGCWGFAISFAFLTNDPNHYLFGGMAALLAVMWSLLFVNRLRKWQQSRQ